MSPLILDLRHSSNTQEARRDRRAQPMTLVLLVLLLLAPGCALISATQVETQPVTPAPVAPVIDVAVLRRVETERAARLAREVSRLRTDLKQAEEALVIAESGLLGTHSRAAAVSSLAETRIGVERAAAAAPWRSGEIDEARAKLEEGARQVDAGHFGAALFFVYRAERIGRALEAEAKKVFATPGTRFVRGRRVNLRAGPSTSHAVVSTLSGGMPVFPESREAEWVLVRTAADEVGWVHVSLLAAQPISSASDPSAATTQSRPAALAR